MNLRELLDLYDNWNGMLKVNDDSLQTLYRGKTMDFAFTDGMYYDAELMKRQVVAFGFYDNEFTVRVKEG